MKKLIWIATGVMAGALALSAQQGRGGPPLAWNDTDNDGICDITGQPVGQMIGRGRVTALGGRGGPGFGGAWGRGRGWGRGGGAWGRGGFRAAGRGFGRFWQLNNPQVQSPQAQSPQAQSPQTQSPQAQSPAENKQTQ